MEFRPLRPALLALLVSLLAGVFAAGLPSASGAQEQPENAAFRQDLYEVLRDSRYLDDWLEAWPMNDDLAFVPVTNERVREIEDEIIELITEQEQAATNLENMAIELAERVIIDAELADHKAELAEHDAELDRNLAGAEAETERTTTAVAQFAVERYIVGAIPANPILEEQGTVLDRANRRALTSMAGEEAVRQRQVFLDQEAHIGDSQELVAENVVLVDEAIDANNFSIAQLEEASRQIFTRSLTIDTLIPDLIVEAQTLRVDTVVVGLELTMVTLDAYVNAENIVEERLPTCGITWETMAGIGEIESDHGRYGGGYVQTNGDLTVPVIGPLLDGTLEDTDIITDTDGGFYDGNAEFDAAVGAMQFIPGTWQRHASDGDGDGDTDPQNLYDAALSTAAYLCTNGDLRNLGTLRDAIFEYNNAIWYVDEVIENKANYEEFVLPEPSLWTILPDDWTLSVDPDADPSTLAFSDEESEIVEVGND